MLIYRVTMKCAAVPEEEGVQAAREIQAELNRRSHHIDAHCWWNRRGLFVTSWDDFDDTGDALRHEFSELIAAHIPKPVQRDDIETVEVLTMS